MILTKLLFLNRHSPCDILPFPKCPPRVQTTKRKRVKTAILMDTPEKRAIEQAYEERKKFAGKKKNNENGKPKKKRPKKKIIIETSSDESDIAVPLEDDDNDDEEEDDEYDEDGNVISESRLSSTDLNPGDFVLVNFATKHRFVRYVGMVEQVEGDEILTQFLRRIQGSQKAWERPTFSIKENDVAHVPKIDVVKKLPQPKRRGGTTRREQLFTFPCNFQGWGVE